eukprot:Hpha_TRINITY_DN16831_c2_g1::TRINITY_DN16831_c2_g1_i1::g.151789::m.151789
MDAPPVAVDKAFSDLAGGEAAPRAFAVRALYSVSHCEEVRDYLLRQKDPVYATLVRIAADPGLSSVRWEALALIGQLCFVEPRKRVVAQPSGLRLAEKFAAVPGIEDTLGAILDGG